MSMAELKIINKPVGLDLTRNLIELLPEKISSLRNIELSDLRMAPSDEIWLFINEIKHVSNGNVFLLTFNSSIDEAKNALLAIMAILGTVIQVEKIDNSFWYSLGVDLNVNPNAGNGIGANPLHVDMLTFTEFPKGMTIFCERPDPKNGGETIISNLAIYKNLPPKYVEVLSNKLFAYWKDEELEQVGHHLDFFSVLPDHDDQLIRFTAKISNWIFSNMRSESKSDMLMLKSISRYTKLLNANKLNVKLESCQALIFSQLYYAHGRSKLGKGQFKIPNNLSRQLWRAYFNF